MNNNLNNTKKIYNKTKMSAILIVIFVGPFAWLYTIKKSAAKFIVGFFVPATMLMLYGWTELIFFIFLSLLAYFAMWLWALIDIAIKPETFYTNYPKG